MKITEKIPIEFILLVVFPAIVFVSGLYISPSAITSIQGLVFSKSTAHFLFFGAGFFQVAFIVFYFYLIIKMAIFIKNALRKILFPEEQVPTLPFSVLRKTLKSVTFLIIVFSAPSVLMLANMMQIGSTTATKVANTSNFLMYLDHTLFGVYVPFWLQKFSHIPILDFILFKSYIFLSVITSVIFVLLLIKDIDILRRFVAAFFLAIMLATPSYYIFPALTPFEMYRNNVTETVIPENIQTTITPYLEETSPRVAGLIDGISSMGSSPEKGYFHVSTFPSMHIAWGTLALYFSFLISVPLGVVASFWYVFNIFGAMYTMEHYGVDMIGGALVGMLSIAIVHYLFTRTKKSSEYPEFFYGIEVFHRDLLWLGENYRDIFRKVKKFLKSDIRILFE